MAEYEAGDFEPPAPVARVVLRGLANVTILNVPLLIDTSSDVSILPADAVDAVGGFMSPPNLTASSTAITSSRQEGHRSPRTNGSGGSPSPSTPPRSSGSARTSRC
jgi:hypothetical protein